MVALLTKEAVSFQSKYIDPESHPESISAGDGGMRDSKHSQSRILRLLVYCTGTIVTPGLVSGLLHKVCVTVRVRHPLSSMSIDLDEFEMWGYSEGQLFCTHHS